MISRVKEQEFIDEILEYVHLAIDDKETDGDRIIGYIVALLVFAGTVNNKRANNFYKEAMGILKEGKVQ